MVWKWILDFVLFLSQLGFIKGILKSKFNLKLIWCIGNSMKLKYFYVNSLYSMENN